MTPDKTCPMNPCAILLEMIRVNPGDVESFKARVCRDYIACPQYHILSGVNQAIIGAITNYNKIKQNTPSIK
ncbi:MAG: hypothetical protein Q8N63_01930 [Nanoarchaeota archaeon]|nr:hypothetical protein [Nanoarchaeota archaeon]